MSQPPAYPPPPPINYSTPSYSRQPGLVTAIGVLSIVIGCFGLLWNLSSALTTFAMIAFATSTRTFATAPATMPSPTTLSVKDYSAETGLSKTDRARVIKGLNTQRPISPSRQKHVDALLADSGQTLIHLSGSDLTPQRVAANITEHGQMPTADGTGRDYFVLGEGRLEIDDKHAVFFPSDGRARIDSADVTALGSSALTDVQITAVIDRIEQISAQRLNATQTASLRTALQTPGQTLVTPGNSVAAAALQVRSASLSPDGSMLIGTPTNVLQFSPTGQITSVFGATVSATTGAKPNTTAAVMLLLWIVGSFALSIYLLVIGILTLRRSLRGAKLHWIYVFIKIPLTLLAGITTWVITANLPSLNSGSAATQESFSSLMLRAIVVFTLIACTYPIGLIFVLRSRTVREYYSYSG